MAILSVSEMSTAETLAGIGYANPFLPERIALEQKALGGRFVSSNPFLQYRPDVSIEAMFPNVAALRELGEQLLERMRSRMVAGYRGSKSELLVYEDLAIYVLYTRYISRLLDLPIVRYCNRPEQDILDAYTDYRRSFSYFFELPEQAFPSALDANIIFAGLFQIERAFFHVFRYIIGSSLAAAHLRAAVWQSVFTHDMRRYSRGLYRLMGNIPTLITGPSGTGKELVARAIAYSQFTEFDPQSRRFATDYTQSFNGLNLSALPAELVESELFGHVKGAFTGASKDRAGYLDEKICGPCGTVFLDEIGELDETIQVKLLRVLQEREYQRVGETRVRKFAGKIVAATNRNLAAEMERGAFREDFYYRLCADRITTPSLSAQLREAPEDLTNFVCFIARQQLPDFEDEVENLTSETVSWINGNLGPEYAWPGNIRELEQCVRSIMIRGTYASAAIDPVASEGESTRRFISDIENGKLTRDELLARYFSIVYLKCGSYRAAAKRLGTDWRTVQRLVGTGRMAK